MNRRPRHKYRARPVETPDRRYDSKREARYAAELQLRKHAGEVVFWLEQVPLHLPGRTKYVVDFVIFEADGRVRFVDVKGVETETFRLKKRQVEALYPVEVEVIK